MTSMNPTNVTDGPWSDPGVAAEERSFAREDQLAGVGIGRVDRVQHVQRAWRLGKGVDRCDRRARLEAGRAGKLQRGEQIQSGKTGIGEVVGNSRAQRARRRAVPGYLTHNRAIILRLGVIGEPGHIPAIDLMIASPQVSSAKPASAIEKPEDERITYLLVLKPLAGWLAAPVLAFRRVTKK